MPEVTLRTVAGGCAGVGVTRVPVEAPGSESGCQFSLVHFRRLSSPDLTKWLEKLDEMVIHTR